MATNPNNAIGTNAAFGGRTSPNAFNDVLACFEGRGILGGWQCLPGNNMVVTLGGQSGVRDVAVAEDNAGNKTTIDNISQQPIELEIATASTTSASTDFIVGYVNNPPEGTATAGDNPGACGLIDVRGSGTTAPTEAQIRAAITADGGTGTTAYYVVLATISVPAGATAITDTNIFQGDKSRTNDYATLNGVIADLADEINTLRVRDNYSTTEQVVGTWIDGKPIYRKVVSHHLLNTGDWSTISGITNVDNLIDLHGYAEESTGEKFYVPYSNASNSGSANAVWFHVNQNTHLIEQAASSGALIRNAVLHLTLEYTKITD